MSTIQPRELTATESAVIDNAGLIAALGKTVIHVGGRPATERLFELARFEPGQHVLDAGCGVGSTAIEIATRFGCRVTAIDIAPAMVERATANVRSAGLGDAVTVQQGDLLSLDFADDTFDRVAVEAVTMFVDRDRAASELVRVCKPGGLVIDHEACFDGLPTSEARESSQALFPGIDLDESPEAWAERYRSAGLVDVEYVRERARFLGPAAMVRDEGIAGTLRIVKNLVSHPSSLRRMRTVMAHQRRVEPYLDYFVLAGRKAA